jgi:hypothetical protein
VPNRISITLTLDGRTLQRKLKALPAQADGYIHAVMVYQASKGESAMKTAAPWTDRTGNARSGLSAKVGWVPNVSHSIHLFHRVFYGIFLETRWSGKYAIILPTIRRLGPDTMRMVSKMFAKLGNGGL